MGHVHYFPFHLRLVIGFFLFFISPSSNAESLKVGALLHLSGDYAAQGEAFRQGIEIAKDEINGAGGIGGIPLQVIYEDTQYSPVKAASGSQKLIHQDKVEAALIATLTEAKVASPVFEKARIPNIVLWDSAPELEALGDYSFGIGPWAPASGRAAAQFLRTRHSAQRVAVIATNVEWSQSVAHSFVSSFKELGGAITEFTSLSPFETDFRTVLTKIKSRRPDALYVPADSGIIPLFQQIKQLQITIPIVTSDIITEDYFTLDAAAFEGVYQTMPHVSNNAVMAELLNKFQRKFDTKCTQALFVAWGYDGLHLIARAHVRASQMRMTLTEALYSMPIYQGASSTIKFNAAGSSPTALGIYQVQSGSFNFIEPALQ